jgi:ABC-2 type transport system permease protein
VSSPLAAQVGHLGRRSVLRTLRQPLSVVPSLFFPLLLLAVNVAGLDRATLLPGFPTDSYLDFALAFTFMQGALFATINAGTDLGRDIETGFLNRLALTPMRGIALVAGQLAGVVVLGLIQATVFLAVGTISGAGIEAGAGGVAVIVGLCLLIAIGFGALGAVLALRTGSGETVQGLFPVLFALLFLSSMNLPRHLIEIDWFREVASYNPVSYLIEAIRSLVVEGWNGEALGLGFAVAGGIAVLALAAAAASLRGRLVRT